MKSDRVPPVSDCPWFWVFLFSAFALILVAIFGGKYRDRQTLMDRRYQARDRVMNDEPVADQLDNQILGEIHAPRRRFVTPDKPLIPIWPLVVLLLSALAVAGYKLRQQRDMYRSIGDWILTR
jgi:hypothetical protein